MDKFPALFARGGLSLDRLRTLCLVAEAGSLTAAAEGDATRVSLYSRQLRELETFCGTRLARRRGKTIALTEAGRELATLARRHFVELTDFLRRSAGEPIELTLGAGASVIEWLLLPRLPALRKTLRAARLRLKRERSEALAARLCEGRLDVAIVREDAALPPLHTAPFAAFGYALFVPRPFAGPARTLRHWLPRVPMIAPPEGWTREQMDAAAASAGIRLRIELEGGSATLALRALRSGQYAAIAPEIAEPELAGADVVTLRPAFLRPLQRRLVLAWHPRHAETRGVVGQAVEALARLCEPLKELPSRGRKER